MKIFDISIAAGLTCILVVLVVGVALSLQNDMDFREQDRKIQHEFTRDLIDIQAQEGRHPNDVILELLNAVNQLHQRVSALESANSVKPVGIGIVPGYMDSILVEYVDIDGNVIERRVEPWGKRK